MFEGEARIPRPGEIVAGKYRLLRVLGAGGMGMVLAAEHLRLRQPIAIKFLNPQLLGVAETVERFEREARAAATLRSRHVVRVTDVEHTPDGVPYMVMELLEGRDLEAQREERKTLPYPEVVDYILQACGALAEAHDAGIVHRDLKPGNLFLARDEAGDRPIIKVLDFGISKFLKGDDAKLTSAGAIMGTALYMSPEQIRGAGSIDGRADIWALGVILYELISGEAPWMGPPTRVAAGIVSEPAPDIRSTSSIPEELASTIHRMLEKNAALRPQTITDVALALAPFAPAGSVGAEVAEIFVRRSQRSVGAQPSGSRPSFNPRGSRPSMAAPPSSSIPSVPAGSERYQVVVSARANPERSTMAATIQTTEGRAQPRALWGVIAAFCTLAVAGLVLILFVARSKGSATPSSTSAAAEPPPSSSTLAVPEPPPVQSKAAAPAQPAACASAPPAPIATARKMPAPPSTAAHPPAPPSTTNAQRPTKPRETASPAINPPFLK